MVDILENLEKVSKRILSAALKADRNPKDINLICVTKTRPAEAIQVAVAAAYTNIGENYLGEALAKKELLDELPIEWHFIGAIQSNKCKLISNNFNWVHSVSSIKVAKKLSQHRPNDMSNLNILLQINVDNETSKSGVLIDDIHAIVSEISHLDNIELRGFMAIPAKRTIEIEQTEVFMKVRDLLSTLQEDFPDLKLDCLSMGMSGDLEAAISAGATHVRIGTDIFGARGYSS